MLDRNSAGCLNNRMVFDNWPEWPIRKNGGRGRADMTSAINQNANAAVQRAIDAAIASGQETGLQVCAYLDGKLVIDAWGGLADPHAGRNVEGDTLFNVFSVTKAVVATAVHMQVERGLLGYDAPVALYWPEYGVNGKQATTVRDALTHRACVSQMPEGVTPERICDWSWMVQHIAAMEPLAEPGSQTMYLSMTFGWILGELVVRSDPRSRPFGRWVLEETAQPLGIGDLWLGVPEHADSRVTVLTNASPAVPTEYLPRLYTASMPPQVGLVPEVFGRPDVRRACVAGVGGVFTARGEARFFAMLAQGGALDGVRLLSEQTVRSFSVPRANSEEPDPVMFNFPLPLSSGGYWLGGAHSPVCSVKSPRAICHPGAGGSIGWADPDNRLAVAICHNRMFNAASPDQDPIFPIAEAVRFGLRL
jgi:CubicO group peptidase (beta-lactamase class C family)